MGELYVGDVMGMKENITSKTNFLDADKLLRVFSSKRHKAW